MKLIHTFSTYLKSFLINRKIIFKTNKNNYKKLTHDFIGIQQTLSREL